MYIKVCTSLVSLLAGGLKMAVASPLIHAPCSSSIHMTQKGDDILLCVMIHQEIKEV